MSSLTDHDTPTLLGFSAIARPDARLLILGSMPGRLSLEANAYYAHPRNQFWPMMEVLFGIDSAQSYQERCQQLTENNIALWDVIRCCVRPGSLDASIRPDSVVVNDFSGLFDSCSSIRLIVFNGSKAEDLFRRYVRPTMGKRLENISCIRLPSTSPAHAALSFERKRELWRDALVEEKGSGWKAP